jgi:hypothetical protein
MTDRKKPGVPFWATVVLVVVLMGYPLSIGPAHCLIWHTNSTWLSETADALYSPLADVCDKSATATSTLFWYDGIWQDYRVRRRFMGVDLPPGFKFEPTAM